MVPSANHLLAGLGTGFCGGVLSGLFGVGGGIVMVPLLGLILHLDQHRAQGATLAAMLLPTGLPAVLQYRRRGIGTSVKLVGVLILAFLFGVYGGAVVANHIPSTALKWTYASFLCFLAIRTWLRHEPPGVNRGDEPFDLSGLWSWGLLIGLLGGVWSGLTGLGGSVVMIPLLASRFHMSQLEAQLTSLMMLLPPIGLPGVYVYAQAQGGLPWGVILGVAVGFAFGGLLGARVATRMASAKLKHAFGWIVLLMAMLVLVRRS